MSEQFRLEHDSMGAIEVPKEALWGAQTQRSILNFAISKDRIPRELIYALAKIKSEEDIVALNITDEKEIHMIQNHQIFYS